MTIEKQYGHVVRDDLDHYRFLTKTIANKLSVTKIRGGRDAMRMKTTEAKEGTITALDWSTWFPKAQALAQKGGM